MNNGVLIFAHNSPKLDYALMALISGGLAKKNLKVPVSLATDKDTIDWMKTSGIFKKCQEVFDKIIKIDKQSTGNLRKLKDGNHQDVVPFINSSRSSAFDITPYDRTLLIDSDYLIFSDNLNNYWDADFDVMISQSTLDLSQTNRNGYQDSYVSDTSVHLYWATTVMFSKNQNAKLFFDLVDHIKNEYQSYSEVYRFDPRMYRNDISFSIAKHILNGLTTDTRGSLPPIPATYDNDILVNVSKDERLTFLISQNGNYYTPMSIKGMDVHIMNKQSIIRNQDQLLELI